MDTAYPYNMFTKSATGERMLKQNLGDCYQHNSMLDLHSGISGNSTGSTFDLNQMVDVTLSVLVTLKLSIVGIIYDDTAVSQVNAITERLSTNDIKLVTYSADDVIATNTDVMGTYLNMVTTVPAEAISLVMSANLSMPEAVFRGFSKYKAQMKQQSGLETFTKWLTVLFCPGQVGKLEKQVTEFNNVAAILPDFNTKGNGTMRDKEILTLIIKPNGRRFERVGMYRGSELHLQGTVFPNINRGFNGRHFRVGINPWYPFTVRKQTKDGIVYEGYCVDLVTELSRRLNFSFTMVEPADGNWGSIEPDGNWTGVVGMLQKFEVDFSAAPLVTTLERETVMDATFPYYYDNVGVLYKRPDPRKNLWKTYFHPFKGEVFLCLLGSLIGSAVIYILLSVIPSMKFSPSDEKGRVRRVILSETNRQSAYLLSSLIQQGHPLLPYVTSGRLFVSFWWIFTLILAAIYRGNLTAFLLVPMDDIPFRTLGELANQDVYKWGVTGSTVVEYLFTVSTRPDFKKIGQGLERFKLTDPEVNSLDSRVHERKVKEGHYAYISDMVPMEIWMAEDCDLRLLKETIIPLPFVIGLHNNSAYLKVFNEQLLDIDQMGLYSVWRDRWWPKGGSCGTDEQHGTKVLSLLETQSAFYILCIGMVLGGVFLFLESCWKLVCCVSFREQIRKQICL